ncbi:hypothetical protein BD289DRAFT_166797 [Coniella lustricola]|uniref:LRR-containing protein second PH domain-containing protein n=1 Tax=Coniella lustricola TaxID=2025994 RepID=A0A2T3AEA8_9PEZI|nr:hypothetical protein BD289DRAFT_166797 [Coniella lustricola]
MPRNEPRPLSTALGDPSSVIAAHSTTMDLLKWRRQSSAQSLQTLALDSPTSSSPGGSSPASSIHESRNSGFFTSVKRSMSRASLVTQKLTESTTPDTPASSSRNVLHKQSGSFSSIDALPRRGSATSIKSRRLSRAYSLSLSSSRQPATGIDFRTAIDWKTQQVEAHCAVEADPQVLRSKPTYLVVTRDYIVKMRNKAEAMAAFPQINIDHDQPHGMMPAPEPLIVIPVHMMVSVFAAEGSRPSFGIEIWWRSSKCRAAYCSTQAYFSLPHDRSEMMRVIVSQLKAKNIEFPEASLVPLEVEAQIVDIFTREEPEFQTCKPEIFPVVRRTSVREDVHSKDKPRKSQDVPSWYLALGRNSCYLAEVTPTLPVDVKYQTFGLVTLESFRANWALHEERFVLSFREPFKPAIRLELASRYYRQIIITFMKADRFLKPCWPTTLQTVDVFRVSGLTDPQLLIAGDNYGGLKRTMDAFLSAYHSPPVNWEINWKTVLAPEFCLLPPKTGGSYTNLQLLAVMRSLRYNAYFNSISFKGVDLSGLWDKTDTAGKTPVPYLNRSCLALSEVELGQMKYGTLLHQEIHGLAFCSEAVRQIDFTDCFTEENSRRNMLAAPGISLGFLFPILNLLELGVTKCNRLLLSGNHLRPTDIHGLIEALITQNVEIQALDLSNCGLSDLALRDIFEVLYHQGHSLQVLNVSGNRGRIHASIFANLIEAVYDLRKLNVSGVIMGDVPGPVISFETLSRFEHLEELDVSKLKINDATLSALEQYLSEKSLPSGSLVPGSPSSVSTPHSTFRKLALNNCGINGREAARLVRALAEHPKAHLHLNGNPLEDGIEDLCRALSLTSGPTGLHIDMVEFRHEASFVALMKALTLNKRIDFLSMAGTAPTPPADEACGPEVCEALEAFFEGNTSVKHLDLSGYSGKLDEGQLAKGFARSLRGLASNQTLTHLRICNQNLHDDVGILGSVIRQNNTLRMIDCQDNSWNLTSIQFLVKSLKLNSSIIDFPFSNTEYKRVWKRVIADVPRQHGTKKVIAGIQHEQEVVLRSAMLKQVQDLKEAVERNRATLEGGVPFAVDFEDSTAAGGKSGWPSLQLKMPTSNNSGTSRYNSHRRLSKQPPPLAPGQQPRRCFTNLQPMPSPARMLDFELDSDLMVSPLEPSMPFDLPVTRKVHEVPEFAVSGSGMRSDASEEESMVNPYHVGHDANALLMLGTPPGTLSPERDNDNGGGASPTDSEMPMTPPESEAGFDSGGGGRGSRDGSRPSHYNGVDYDDDDNDDEGSDDEKTPDAGLLMRRRMASGSTADASASDSGLGSSVVSFDMGPYFSGGREFVINRFRVGGLEAHEEE